jgi:hypothetical protein
MPEASSDSSQTNPKERTQFQSEVKQIKPHDAEKKKMRFSLLNFLRPWNQ